MQQLLEVLPSFCTPMVAVGNENINRHILYEYIKDSRKNILITSSQVEWWLGQGFPRALLNDWNPTLLELPEVLWVLDYPSESQISIQLFNALESQCCDFVAAIHAFSPTALAIFEQQRELLITGNDAGALALHKHHSSLVRTQNTVTRVQRSGKSDETVSSMYRFEMQELDVG
jgi:hypothetical protein